jgi:Zn-dependent protease with chaperone function
MSNFQFYRSSGGIGQILISALVMVGIFIGLFWIARGLFTILTYAAPLLLIAALIINYKVVTGYVQWLWTTLNRDPLMGLIYTVLSFIGFPILSAYLLFKALAVNRIGTIEQELKQNIGNGERVVDAEYEILEDEPLEMNRPDDMRRYEELFDSEK